MPQKRSFQFLPFFILILNSVVYSQPNTPNLTDLGTAAAPGRPFSLGERIACQAAIEEVYWRHRTAAAAGATQPSFNEAVPRGLIQRKAEDAILKSLALERYWGATITGNQLQAELNRMAASSKSPDMLAELFAAVGNDSQNAAECLARPLLVDRLIQTYFAHDERFHSELKARAQTELANAAPAAMRNMSGQYRETEWQRGRVGLRAGAIPLEANEFDRRIRGLRTAFGDPSAKMTVGRVSSLREDEHRFYAVSLITQDAEHVLWPRSSGRRLRSKHGGRTHDNNCPCRWLLLRTTTCCPQ
jgi:hypothetical protein